VDCHSGDEGKKKTFKTKKESQKMSKHQDLQQATRGNSASIEGPEHRLSKGKEEDRV